MAHDPRDLDETARLLLMEHEAERDFGLYKFVKAMQEVHPGLALNDATTLYSKYRGMDGRIRPTHRIDTGEPIR